MKRKIDYCAASVLKLIFSGLILVFLTDCAFATGTPRSWVGGTSDWNTPGNWSPSGIPGSSDPLTIGVSGFTNQPTIGTNTTAANAVCASITFGTTKNITLTVSTGSTLVVSGDITQMHNPTTPGITTNIAQTVVGGVGGSISCVNFNVGDSTVPSGGLFALINSLVANVTINTVVNTAIQSFVVSGNLNLTATSAQESYLLLLTTGVVDNPTLNINDGSISVGGKIQTSNTNYINVAGFNFSLLGLGLVSFGSAINLSQVILNPTGNASGTTPTLYLKGASALNLATQGSFVDFYGSGSGKSTVTYNGTGQTIYTNNTTGLDASPQVYYNLIVSGSGTVNTGSLTVGNDVTSSGTVNMNSNSPTAVVGDNWANSGNVTQGMGDITISNILSNTANTFQLGAGNLTVPNVQINGGSIAGGTGTGVVTNAISFQITAGSYVCNAEDIYINGSYTNAATFTGGTGTVYFNGNAAQALQDNSTTGTQLNTVSFSGTSLSNAKTMSGTGSFVVSTTGIVKMVGATTKVDAGGILTLSSDTLNSATVNPITAGSTIIGNVNVQRAVKGGIGRRGYRLLSSPVWGSTDASSNNIYSLYYLIKKAYISGTTGVPGGFDKAGNPTIYLFRENTAYSNATFTSGNFRGINTLGNSTNFGYLIDGDTGTFNIPVGNGFLFFFRGDRGADLLTNETLTTYLPTNTVFTTTGTLNQQQVIVHDWYTPASPYLGWTATTGNGHVQGDNLVGNPYASSIDWESYNTSTVTNTNGINAQNVGITIYTYNARTGNYDTYQKGGAHTNNGTNLIASGEGFFVVASNNSNPQLVFNESAKTTTEKTGNSLYMTAKTRSLASAVGSDAVNNTEAHLQLQLLKDSTASDDIYIGLDSGAVTKYVFNEDVPYMSGRGAVSLCSISSDNVPLAINRLPLSMKNDTVALRVNATADGLYTFNLTTMQNIPPLFDVWLMDAYKKDSIDLGHNKTYAFNLYLHDTTSYGLKRFSLIIRQNVALGVHLLSFNAVKAAKGAQLTWKAENEANYTNFTVQRSTDNGVTFSDINSLASTNTGTYAFLDINPPVAADSYRVKVRDLDDSITYTKMVTLMYSGQSSSIVVNTVNLYPSPASSVINVAIAPKNSSPAGTLPTQQASTGTYDIKILNGMGAIIKTASSTNANWHSDISDLVPGTYIVYVVNNANKSLVGTSTFVKL